MKVNTEQSTENIESETNLLTKKEWQAPTMEIIEIDKNIDFLRNTVAS